jgi:hypothetical protein
MIVNVFAGADPPYGLVDGINSGRTLSMLMRAIMSWYAFGRYNHVIVDLTSFDEWSPRVADQLATAVTTAADGGRWLAFFPVAEHQLRGADLDRIHFFPDRAQAQLAMQKNRLPAIRKRPMGLLSSRFRTKAVTVFPNSSQPHRLLHTATPTPIAGMH